MKLPSSISILQSELFNGSQKTILVKRDDLIDPIISGNKWRKLKFNLEKFKEGNYTSLLTFGGAYSNHIAATAELGRKYNVPTIGVIRGDELNENSNSTLKAAAEAGMQLEFTSRQEYDLIEEKYYHEELRRRHGHILIVPEGGANFYGLLGCTEIMNELPNDVEAIFCAAGTGTTVAGLLLGADDTKVYAVAALKGADFLRNNIKLRLVEAGLDDELIEEKLGQLSLLTDYHFGGYAKYNQELLDFISSFEQAENIKIDQVYTAKMFYALADLLAKNAVPENKIVALHTGGIQGRATIEHLLT